MFNPVYYFFCDASGLSSFMIWASVTVESNPLLMTKSDFLRPAGIGIFGSFIVVYPSRLT